MNKLIGYLRVTKWIQLVFVLEAIYIFVVFKFNDGFNLILGKTEMELGQLLNALGIFLVIQILCWYLYNRDLAKENMDKLFEESEVVGNLRR